MSHAVHLAEAAFLQALLPKKKVKKGGKDVEVPILAPLQDSPDGSFEDTEDCLGLFFFFPKNESILH